MIFLDEQEKETEVVEAEAEAVKDDAQAEAKEEVSDAKNFEQLFAMISTLTDIIKNQNQPATQTTVETPQKADETTESETEEDETPIPTGESEESLAGESEVSESADEIDKLLDI